MDALYAYKHNRQEPKEYLKDRESLSEYQARKKKEKANIK